MDLSSKRNRFVLQAGALAGLLVFLSLPSLAGAVTVGPTKLQISADPGRTVTGTLFLKNDEYKTQTFYPSIKNFSVTPDGQKDFSKDSLTIAKWMQLPASVTLEPQGEQQVPFTMVLPQDAAPGGHFAVIWWSTSPPEDGGQLAIVTRAGILVYLRVSGDITEKGHITSFDSHPSFAWGLPVVFSMNFVDEGNVALTPQGEIRVTNIFGTLKAVLPVNPYGGVILPASSGSFSSAWEGKGFFLGAYRASIHLIYGESSQTADKDMWFVIISPPAAALLALLIILVFIAPPLLRRYNRWVIERAKQQL